MADNVWHIADRGQSIGPMTLDELVARLPQYGGEAALVFGPGLGAWTAAGSVEAVRARLRGPTVGGIADVARDEMIPVIFGVLTTNTEQQALDRTGGPHGHAGERAAEAAVEMIGLMARTKARPKTKR